MVEGTFSAYSDNAAGLIWLHAQLDRYEEYPKMRELIQRKDDLVAQRATPPYFLKVTPARSPKMAHINAIAG